MSEVIVKPSFIDSPKKLLIRDLHVAFARGDVSTVCDSFYENSVWQIVGRKKLGEIENIEIDGSWMVKCKVSQLVIDSIIENDQEAFVSGTIYFVDKSQFSFATIFMFKESLGAKIESLNTFLLRHDKT